MQILLIRPCVQTVCLGGRSICISVWGLRERERECVYVCVTHLILDGGGADEHELVLDHVVNLRHALVATLHQRLRLLQPQRPLAVLLLRHLLAGDAQRAQADLGEGLHVGHRRLHRLVAAAQALDDFVIGTLHQERDLRQGVRGINASSVVVMCGVVRAVCGAP